MRKRIILSVILLLFFVVNITNAQSPYVEGSTGAFEIVISYNDIAAKKETKLTIYLSDFKTNIPIENAKIGLDIQGVDNSKIKVQPTPDAGIYEAFVEFPEFKKYNFLVDIKSASGNDLIAINDVDIAQKEEVKTTTVSRSFLTVIHDNLTAIIIITILLLVIAFLFYRIGFNNRSSLKSKKDFEL